MRAAASPRGAAASVTAASPAAVAAAEEAKALAGSLAEAARSAAEAQQQMQQQQEEADAANVKLKQSRRARVERVERLERVARESTVDDAREAREAREADAFAASLEQRNDALAAETQQLNDAAAANKTAAVAGVSVEVPATREAEAKQLEVPAASPENKGMWTVAENDALVALLAEFPAKNAAGKRTDTNKRYSSIKKELALRVEGCVRGKADIRDRARELTGEPKKKEKRKG